MRSALFGTTMILLTMNRLVLADEPRLPGLAAAIGVPIAQQFDAGATSNPPAPSLIQEPRCHGTGCFWGSAEFLLWQIKGANVPPLVTTGSVDSLGILGLPGTTTLYGGNVDYSARTGGRFALGFGLNCDCTTGIELGYFFLGGGANRFGASSSGDANSSVLSRPFINVNPDPNEQSVQIVAFPGVASGSVQVFSSSSLQGADLNMFCNLFCRPACCESNCEPADLCKFDAFRRASFRVDIFAGPRWLQLNEDLAIAEQVTDLATGTSFSIVDRFETRNNFYGGQVGARAEWQRGRYFVNVLGKVAVGATHQEVRIRGTTVITEPGGAPNVQQGGLLALPTNIGTYSRDKFSVVPEIGTNFGCQVSDRLRIFAGYTFLYWSNVVRPGDQIDLGINPTQLPTAAGPGVLVGPARPAFTFRDTDFWAHGINLGLEFQW